MADAAGEPLTIIAGGGAVPLTVAKAATAAGRRVFIIGLAGEAGAEITAYPHEWVKWGEIGRFESLLAANGGRDVVLVGAIRSRPDFSSLKLDFGAIRILPEVMKLIANGDSSLLSGVVRLIEARGYRVLGAHEIATDLVAGEGAIGRIRPEASAERDAQLAIAAARAIGSIDAGQAAVAVNGRVVALEAAEGTDQMLKRVTALRESGRIKWNGRAGILAKCAKPQQDLRVDMPTIGPGTIEAVAEAGLTGIAVEVGRVMIVARPEVIARADRDGVFVIGLRRPAAGSAA